MDRIKFVNKLLKYASSAENPKECIKHMLRNLGREYGADRVYVFEANDEGTFSNSYEWHNSAQSSHEHRFDKLPFDGFIETWYNEFEYKGYVYITDMDEYKKVNEVMYKVLHEEDIKTLIIWPMYLDERCIGFLGIDNPPVDSMEDIKLVMKLMSYFIATLIRYRDSMKRLEQMGFEDQLTGVMNRHALEVFNTKEFNKLSTIGILSCDINGLKRANDSNGHEAGDKLITDVAESLTVVFGKKNVYRIGGDEFIAIHKEGDEAQFEVKIAQAKQLISYKNVNIASGHTYRRDTEKNVVELLKEVDAKMYADKARFYADSRHERRNRR